MKAQVIFKEQAPWFTIAHAVQLKPVRKEVIDFKLSPFGRHTFYGVDIKESAHDARTRARAVGNPARERPTGLFIAASPMAARARFANDPRESTLTAIRSTPYTGIYPIAPTPFTASGDLDLDGQRRVLDCMIDQGVDGICILANYSEQFLLTDDERATLLDLCLVACRRPRSGHRHLQPFQHAHRRRARHAPPPRPAPRC